MFKKVFLGTICLFLIFGCSACSNKARTGAGLGTLGGALIGSMTGHGEIVPTLIGAGIGAGVGYIIGNEMDKYDKKKIGQTLENTPTNQSTEWVNPDTNRKYKATPTKTKYTNQGNPVRWIRLKADTNGDGKFDETTKAKAKRIRNEEWVLIQ